MGARGEIDCRLRALSARDGMAAASAGSIIEHHEGLARFGEDTPLYAPLGFRCRSPPLRTLYQPLRADARLSHLAV